MGNFEITGRVSEMQSGAGVPGVVVVAYDKDHNFDDRLGRVLTDAEGNFELQYDKRDFRDLFERAPDIYLVVTTTAGKTLHTTEGATRFDAGKHERFELKLPAETLVGAGLRVAEGELPELSPERLASLPCLDEADADDELAAGIREDLSEHASVLALMRAYMRELVGDTRNDAPVLAKLAKLFDLGEAPEGPVGHHYGVTLGLRTGDLPEALADYGNLLGWVWGAAIGKTCPWVGKSFAAMAEGDRRQVTGAALPDGARVYRGINHFNLIEHAPINLAGNALLDFMWELDDAPANEQLRWGHERNGGHFVAHRAPSVYAGTPREVLRLNYRFPGLGNHLPLPLLIDELVEIAEGVYLGQLLFATERVFERYDPSAPDARYGYQHFGYFLLFDEVFNAEARRLFPHLEVPRAALSTRTPGAEGPRVAGGAGPGAGKFETLTLLDPLPEFVDREALAELRRDLVDAGSVLALMKSYAGALAHTPRTDSPIFAKLAALFQAGIAPEDMDGYYAGALVSWLGQGMLGAFDVNSLNIVWQICRPFSPWTGKRFDALSPERLAELTDGRERGGGDLPTRLGSNTVVFRSAKEKLVGAMMKAMHLWVDEADADERREHGYEAKTFFFIGKPAASVAPANAGKRVYQFNYRWKPLKNPPPDFLCVDELVQIADGLFLGQVYYSTKPLEPWDPATDPASYEYELYEYFLLMDEQWQARRLRLGFDLDNT